MTLSESNIQELVCEIKSVQRIFIKKVTEINRKSKGISDLSSLSNESNSKQVEFNDEQIPSSKDIFDLHLNFLTETLHFLQMTCESTSRLLCTHSKGKEINYILTLITPTFLMLVKPGEISKIVFSKYFDISGTINYLLSASD